MSYGYLGSFWAPVSVSLDTVCSPMCGGLLSPLSPEGRGVGGGAMPHDPRLIAHARRLRRELTPTEKLLWYQLRGRRFGGYRFRRQHIIDPYIADFYCADATLVIELDGETHLGKEEQDRCRQAYLESNG